MSSLDLLLETGTKILKSEFGLNSFVELANGNCGSEISFLLSILLKLGKLEFPWLYN